MFVLTHHPHDPIEMAGGTTFYFVFTALSYRAMSREFAISGSVYSYVQRGLNPYIGFIPAG